MCGNWVHNIIINKKKKNWRKKTFSIKFMLIMLWTLKAMWLIHAWGVGDGILLALGMFDGNMAVVDLNHLQIDVTMAQ